MKSNIWQLLTRLRPYRGYVALNIAFNLLSVLFMTFSFVLIKPFLEILFNVAQPATQPVVFSYSLDYVFAYLNQYLIEYISKSGKIAALQWVCQLIVVVFLGKTLFRYLATFVIAPARTGVIRDMRRQIFDKILRLPLAFFSEERKGDLMARATSDVQEIEWGILRIIETMVKEPITIVLSLVAMISISPRLTIFAFVLIIFIGGVIGQVGKSLKKKSLRAQNKLGDTLSVLDEAITGLRIIKAFNAQHYQHQKFEKENNEVQRLNTRLIWRNTLASPLAEFLGVSVMVVLLLYGGQTVFRGELAPATFFVFIGMFYNIIAPAKSFSGALYSVQQGMGAMERLHKILHAPITIQNVAQPLPLQGFDHQIEYKNVSFSYDSTTSVLHKINLTIPKGKTIALVGLSGAGKTTLADLLPRFYDVTEGGIFIDGQDIRQVGVENLRSLMGIVTQTPILFNDTIFNNIAFGLENATKEAVMEAATIANAHDFITQTERGYDTIIGDQGQKLSGGQRQRLTIARAVLRNPPILILDEATSSLDSESEKLVQDALQKLMKNRTSIVIAHRLSTVQNADEIVVLQEGQVVERGNHETLLKSEKGIYRKLVHLQMI